MLRWAVPWHNWKTMKSLFWLLVYDKINALKSVWYSILTTGAVMVLAQCPMNSGNARSVSDSSLENTSFLRPISDCTIMPCWSLIKLVHVNFIPTVFSRNICSLRCYGKFPLGFHRTASLPINIRKKWTLLDRKVRRHFERAKHYQHYINLCQHLKWQTSRQLIFKSATFGPPKMWSCKVTEAEWTLDSIQALFQIDHKQLINIKLILVYNALPNLGGGETSVDSIKMCFNPRWQFTNFWTRRIRQNSDF